jgi:ketosteroid isomerase-like protein
VPRGSEAVTLPDELSVLVDKQTIRDVVHRYGYALDNRDWALLRTCFVPDVVGHYGGDPLRGYEALEQLCRTTLTPLSASQHLIGNVLVTVDGNDATCSCYLQAQHVRQGAPGGDHFLYAGRYSDRLTRTSDGWRIAERTLSAMWTSGNPAVINRPLATLA